MFIVQLIEPNQPLQEAIQQKLNLAYTEEAAMEVADCLSEPNWNGDILAWCEAQLSPEERQAVKSISSDD